MTQAGQAGRPEPPNPTQSSGDDRRPPVTGSVVLEEPMLPEKRLDARAQVRPVLTFRGVSAASDHGSPTSKRVVTREHHDGAHDGHEHAPDAL